MSLLHCNFVSIIYLVPTLFSNTELNILIKNCVVCGSICWPKKSFHMKNCFPVLILLGLKGLDVEYINEYSKWNVMFMFLMGCLKVQF